jgi:replicative DNA helicase
MLNVDGLQAATEPSLFDGDPIPLVHIRAVETFPMDALPEVYRSMVEAVAEATQTDVAMAAVTALTVLAAAAGGRTEVEARSGWREPLCLYTATIARPGDRKSAVQAMMSAPLLDVERELAEQGTAIRVEAETVRQIAIKDAERARAAASSAEGDAKKRLQADAVSAALLAEALVVPSIPRFLADDVTPEAAGSLLASQGGRLAIISSEGGIFDIIAGRYNGQVPAMDLWLKAHSGDPLRVDRKGREPEYIRRPALTLGLMLQPSVLTAIGRHEIFRGRGLLARFLYSEPVSKIGHRKAGAAGVPDQVFTRYDQEVRDLVKELAEWTDPAIIRFSPEAPRDIIKLEEATEPSLAGDGELASLADWGSKYVGAVLRIAGLLHLGQHGPKGVRLAIDQGTLLSAVRIGTYFKNQAVQAFTTMHLDTATADALYLLDRLGKANAATISKRDLFNLARSRFKMMAEMDPSLLRLIDHGFLAVLPEPEKKSPGRKPSPQFAIHPATQKYTAHYAERAQTSR